MLREYIDEAMKRAHYEMIDRPGGTFYGEIPGLDGVMASVWRVAPHPLD